MRAFSVALVVGLACLPSIVSAHHSPAMFDMQKRLTLTGTVREFQWTNPHSYIQLVVKDKTGKDVEWSLEMAGPTSLYNNGWRPSTLKRGDRIVATIAPLAKGTSGGLVIMVTTTDGRKLGGGKP